MKAPTAHANPPPTARASEPTAIGWSVVPSNESQMPSWSESDGMLDRFLKSVPHLDSSLLVHPSPSMSLSRPALVMPSCT